MTIKTIKNKLNKIREIACNQICNHEKEIFNLLVLQQVSEKVMDNTSFVRDVILQQRHDLLMSKSLKNNVDIRIDIAMQQAQQHFVRENVAGTVRGGTEMHVWPQIWQQVRSHIYLKLKKEVES